MAHSLWSIEKTYLKRYLKISPSNPNSYTVSLLDSILILNSSPKLFKHLKISRILHITYVIAWIRSTGSTESFEKHLSWNSSMKTFKSPIFEMQDWVRDWYWCLILYCQRVQYRLSKQQSVLPSSRPEIFSSLFETNVKNLLVVKQVFFWF